MQKQMLTTGQVAERLGVTMRRVQAMLKSGKFKNAEKYGDRVWLIPATDLNLVAVVNRKIGRPAKRKQVVQ